MKSTHAPISNKMNFMMNLPTTTMTREKVTNQLKSLLLYSRINSDRDFPNICKNLYIMVYQFYQNELHI